MATSRQTYALKHERRLVATLYSIAIGVSSLTHAMLAPDRERRRGHLRAVAQLAARRSTIDARPTGQAR
jgi:hypothetical protein